MKIKNVILATTLVVSPFFLSVNATPIIMEGNFVKTAISDNGTLGYGGSTSPGLLHDATGTRTFGYDYLTPGDPWEIFSVLSDQTNLLSNNNANTGDISGTLTDISSSSSYDSAVNWSATYGALFSISTDTYFNVGDERVSFFTTITALEDLSGLSFLRAIDPDPDNYPGGSASTNNGRGFGVIAPENWVHSVGTVTGLTLGLYSDSSVEHNTAISSAWSYSPTDYLSGNNDGNGDNTIGIAFDIGNLMAGESSSFDYHYVMGEELDEIDVPVPEPSTLAIFTLGFMGLISRRFSKKS